jgi:hypothetical protein
MRPFPSDRIGKESMKKRKADGWKSAKKSSVKFMGYVGRYVSGKKVEVKK